MNWTTASPPQTQPEKLFTHAVVSTSPAASLKVWQIHLRQSVHVLENEENSNRSCQILMTNKLNQRLVGMKRIKAPWPRHTDQSQKSTRRGNISQSALDPRHHMWDCNMPPAFGCLGPSPAARKRQLRVKLREVWSESVFDIRLTCYPFCRN